MASNDLYLKTGRLADILALIQVLSLDKHPHRSESGLLEELQGAPRSAESWTALASEHPEFFRVRVESVHQVSLVARHVTPKDETNIRVLPSDYTSKLLQLAIELHDRQVRRAQSWHLYIPIVVAITAGLFTLFGIVLKGWLSTRS